MTGLSITQKVVLGTALLGGTAGVVGSFAVLRRRSLVGDMLAHAALPGVCLVFLIFGSRNLLHLASGALVSGLLAVGVVSFVTRWTRTKEDAAIGIALSTFFGLGVVLLSEIQKAGVGGNKSGLDTYLFGEPANMLTSDLYLLAAVAAAALLLVGLFYKEFKVVCFDADFAGSQGWPALSLDLAMMAIVAVVAVVGLPIVGVILMAAMLILPAVTARFWTDRLSVMLLLAGALGIASSVIGATVGRGLPTGAKIVLVAASAFAVSVFLAPKRGIVARLWSELRLRARIAREHLLRSLFEASEPTLPDAAVVHPGQLTGLSPWESWFFDRVVGNAVDKGLVEETHGGLRLTPLGLRKAAEVTRAHRLWELYLVEHAGIAADHVHRDADDLEHLLPEALLIELEQKLAATGSLPALAVPESPHTAEETQPAHDRKAAHDREATNDKEGGAS